MEELNILSPGERLKKIRKYLKIKQEELAGDRFSKNYISMFENDKRNINPVNATYLIQKINNIAKDKGLNYTVTSSYLLKNERDMACDKCQDWIKEIMENHKLGEVTVNMNLYKVLILANKYGIEDFIGTALYHKGIHALNTHRYNCAIIQLLEAITYFSRLRKEKDVIQSYKNIGIAFYKQQNFRQAIAIFILAEAKARACGEICTKVLDQIKFYQALSYFGLEDYTKAKEMVDVVSNKQEFILELEDKIGGFF